MPHVRTSIVSAIAGLTVLATTCASAFGQTAPATRPAKPGPYAEQLARECDALLALAVRRNYGWGWPAEAPVVTKARVPGVPIAMDPPGSAAAGLILALAADALDRADYRDAAIHVGRGIAVAQRPVGQIPAKPIFGPAPGVGREDLTLVADRGATEAALGLLLTLVDGGAQDEPVRRAASRAATWLMRQQTPTGAWVTGYPPATAPKDATRLVRLDTAEYRNSTLAALYAYEVLHDPLMRRSAERSIEMLLKLRLNDASKPGAKLWPAVCLPDTVFSDLVPGSPIGISPPATRNAIQTLMAAYVILGTPDTGTALFEAAAGVDALPRVEGRWALTYDFAGAPTLPAPTTAPGAAPFIDVAPPAPGAGAARLGRFGLETLLPDVDRLKVLGRPEYQAQLAGGLPYRTHLAAALCGLEDEPLNSNWPVRIEEVPAYLKATEKQWRWLKGEPPSEFDVRLHRLWVLLLRVKLEQWGGV